VDDDLFSAEQANPHNARMPGCGSVARAVLLATLPAALLLCSLVAPRPAGATPPLEIGLRDPVYSSPLDPVRRLWLERTAGVGATTVGLTVPWRAVAPQPPGQGSDPRDPSNPAYRWGAVDAAVRDASANGFEILLIVTTAPYWAEGNDRPDLQTAPAGSWRPDPGAYGDFAHAVAVRYSGNFSVQPDAPDPGLLPGPTPPPAPSEPLPRVRYFQAWNEPNLSLYLNPQWEGTAAASPLHYRRMLNAFYAGVKAAEPGNQVLTAGTAPYGDPPQGRRMRPVRFWRDLLCLKGRTRLRGVACEDPAHFDILAHHPINDGRPREHARHPDDASTFDLGRIKRVVRKAIKTARVVPAGPKPLWVTEFWWRSSPPDPSGVPVEAHARWLEQALYLFWKQGVERAIWYQIRDPAQPGNPLFTAATGLFLDDVEPKPAYQALRFPFVTERRNTRRVRAWGRSPESGQLLVQRQASSGGWKSLKAIEVTAGAVFTASLRLRGDEDLRALLPSGEASLSWHQR